MRSALAILFLLAAVQSESEPNGFDPELVDDSGNAVKSYSANLSSLDVSEIALKPELRARDDDEIGGARLICGYSLSGSEEIPFEVVVKDRLTGEASLVLRNGVPIKFFKGEQYVLNITAFDCGGPLRHSQPARVVITVTGGLLDEDAVSPPSVSHVKEPAFFDQATYAATVREGTMYDRIINVRPNLVESPDVALPDVCSYGIRSTDAPFTIDRYGNIRNTEPLSYSSVKSYILDVFATSCSGEQSASALVTIKVTELCTPGWKNVPASAEFLTGAGVLNFMESAKLETCEDNCAAQKVTATVAFTSKQPSKVCEKDIQSIRLQRKTCGASGATIDLLPPTAAERSWTKDLPTVDADSYGQEVFNFDGKSAVIVPKHVVNHTLTDHFTFSMWMKHDDHFDNTPKEQIVCSADGDVMNRQHYSLFIHNCRLIFLLRKESYQVDSLMKLYPAEWRWDIPHVCDGLWHHYALSVDYPQVRLYVDGSRVDVDPHSVDILDDWALHPTKNVRFTELSVGACWQGSSHKMTEHFNGHISGLSLLNDHSESDRVVKCLNVCGEKLSFHSVDALLPGMSVAYDSDMSRITIKGASPDEVERIARLVGYENRHQHPLHGDRSFSIVTNVVCNGVSLQVPDVAAKIKVIEADDPQITITGIGSKSRSPKEFARGFNLFTEILIESRRKAVGAKDATAPESLEDINMVMIDKCQVRANKPMNTLGGGETLALPDGLLDKYLLESSESDQGFDVSGADLFSTYAEVLRGVVYRNDKVDESFPGRTFTVRCFNINGQFESNDFVLHVKVVSNPVNDVTQIAAAHAQIAKNGVAESGAFAKDTSEETPQKTPAAASSPTGALMIVTIGVVSAAFLTAIIAMAVIRIRKSQRRHKTGANVLVEEGPEMEWDNSTLNLTINPLEQVACAGGKDDESDSEDECRSLKGKDAAESESEEDESEAVKERDLEWDNSTLSY